MMLRSKHRARERQKIADEAAEWVLQVENAGIDLSAPCQDPTDLQRRFLAWVKTSPLHLKEFMELYEAYSELNRVDVRELMDVDALTELPAAEVVRLFDEIGPKQAAPARSPHRRLPAALAAAVVVAVLVAAGLLWPRSTTFTTVVGEQYSSKLADGSVVTLNTDSRVEVRYTGASRILRLLQGEALFVVENDARRPFVVDAGDVAVTALGTQFNIYRHDSVTDIAVTEGLVRIATRPGEHTEVSAGEQAHVDGGRITIRRNANIAAAIAWRDRKLVFDDAPLAAVVGELNRYNRGKVILEGDVGVGKRVSATFENDDPLSLVRFMSSEWGLVGRMEGEDWVFGDRSVLLRE